VRTMQGGYKVMADGYCLPVDPYLSNVGDLWARGWSIFPLRPRSKAPLQPWAEYQKRPPSFEELDAWLTRPERLNFGIATGRVSGIFVLDVDSEAAMAWANEHFPPCTLRVKTAKGKHFYYPYSGDRPLRNTVRVKYQGEALDIDVRAEGGYVVAPGSVHPSGFVYTAEGEGFR
jgi:putative DNA primase/helicase